MADKGILSRTLNGRTHVYAAMIPAGATRNALIDRIVDAAFGGFGNQACSAGIGK